MSRPSILLWSLAILVGAAPLGCDGEAETEPVEFNALPVAHVELGTGDVQAHGAIFDVALTDGDDEQCTLRMEYSIDEGHSYEVASVAEADLGAINIDGELIDLPCPEAEDEPFRVVWDMAGDLGSDAMAEHIWMRFIPKDAQDKGQPDHLHLDLNPDRIALHGSYRYPTMVAPQYQYHHISLLVMEATAGGLVATGELIEGEVEHLTEQDGSHTWYFEVDNPPPEEHMRELEDGLLPAGTAALYLPLVWRDMDADEQLGELDTVVGVPRQSFYGYVDPSSGWGSSGWMAFSVDPWNDADLPSVSYGTWDVDMEINLKGYPLEETALELEVAGGPEDDGLLRRLGVMPPLEENEIPGDGFVELTSAEYNPTTTEVDVALDGAMIPDEHMLEEDWGAAETLRALETMVLYIERPPENEQADEGEEVSHDVVIESSGAPVYVYYLEGAITPDDAWSWSLDDCWLGFDVVSFELSEDETYEIHTCHDIGALPALEYAERPASGA